MLLGYMTFSPRFVQRFEQCAGDAAGRKIAFPYMFRNRLFRIRTSPSVRQSSDAGIYFLIGGGPAEAITKSDGRPEPPATAARTCGYASRPFSKICRDCMVGLESG